MEFEQNQGLYDPYSSHILTKKVQRTKITYHKQGNYTDDNLTVCIYIYLCYVYIMT